MILLEINEFNLPLLKKAAISLNLPHLKKLLKFKHSITSSPEKKERFGLDPWVQWVSIHTGEKYNSHKIRHLGDVQHLRKKQIWEDLGSIGISSGVWGPMNAVFKDSKNCKFFFPDPWSYSEKAYPSELNLLLSFPRYFSKNYGDLDWSMITINFLKLIIFFSKPRIFALLIMKAPYLLFNLFKNKFKSYILFALFDYISVILFRDFFTKSKPNFAIFFSNSIAHLQHNYWHNKSGINKEMAATFKILDKIVGEIFAISRPNEPIIVMNAFSQKCTFDENEYLYRQKNPVKFLELAEIRFISVEQLMTNDGFVFFNTKKDCLNAYKILKQAKIGKKFIFDVEFDLKNHKKLFYQMAVFEYLDPNTVLYINKKKINFFEVFYKVIRRSGSHINQGDVLYKNFKLPKSFSNFRLNLYIKKYFKKS